jgi:hypothetical protein
MRIARINRMSIGRKIISAPGCEALASTKHQVAPRVIARRFGAFDT